MRKRQKVSVAADSSMADWLAAEVVEPAPVESSATPVPSVEHWGSHGSGLERLLAGDPGDGPEVLLDFRTQVMDPLTEPRCGKHVDRRIATGMFDALAAEMGLDVETFVDRDEVAGATVGLDDYRAMNDASTKAFFERMNRRSREQKEAS